MHLYIVTSSDTERLKAVLIDYEHLSWVIISAEYLSNINCRASAASPDIPAIY